MGPVQYFSKFLLEKDPRIEQYDNYNKQSYRNRCIIYGANGPVKLVIPIKRMRGNKNLVKDITIDYDTDWRRLHWKGIVSAYNSSPFFEFYRDSIEPFYTGKYEFLVDYCFSITSQLINLVDIDANPVLTDEFLFPEDQQIDLDFRFIHPKMDLKEDKYFKIMEYKQVFSEKYGFIPNLSILDLIFNLGPETKGYLKKTLSD